VAIALKVYVLFIPYLIGLFLAIAISRQLIKIPAIVVFLTILKCLYLLGFAIPEIDSLWVGAIRQPAIVKDNLQLLTN